VRLLTKQQLAANAEILKLCAQLREQINKRFAPPSKITKTVTDLTTPGGNASYTYRPEMRVLGNARDESYLAEWRILENYDKGILIPSVLEAKITEWTRLQHTPTELATLDAALRRDMETEAADACVILSTLVRCGRISTTVKGIGPKP
jgi:hypothetical protein